MNELTSPHPNVMRSIRALEQTVDHVQKLEASDIEHLDVLKEELSALFRQMQSTDLSALDPETRREFMGYLKRQQQASQKTSTILFDRKKKLLNVLESKEKLFAGPYQTLRFVESFSVLHPLHQDYLILLSFAKTVPSKTVALCLQYVAKFESDILFSIPAKPHPVFGYRGVAHLESIEKLQKIGAKLELQDSLRMDCVRLPHWEDAVSLAALIVETIAHRVKNPKTPWGAYQLEVRQKEHPEHQFIIHDQEEDSSQEDPESAAYFQDGWLLIHQDKLVLMRLAKAINKKYGIPTNGLEKDLEGDRKKGICFCLYRKAQLTEIFKLFIDNSLNVPERIRYVLVDQSGLPNLPMVEIVEKMQNEFEYFGLAALMPNEKPSAILTAMINKYALSPIWIEKFYKGSFSDLDVLGNG